MNRSRELFHYFLYRLGRFFPERKQMKVRNTTEWISKYFVVQLLISRQIIKSQISQTNLNDKITQKRKVNRFGTAFLVWLEI